MAVQADPTIRPYSTGASLQLWIRACFVAAWLVAASTSTFARDKPRSIPEDEAVLRTLIKIATEATWPDSVRPTGSNTLRIGLLASESDRSRRDNLSERIEKLAPNGTVARGSIRLIQGITLQELEGCQMIFAEDTDEAKKAASELAGRPVLVATYSPNGFKKTGCAIELVLTNEGMRFILNSGAFKTQGIAPNGTLLDIALENRSGPSPKAPDRPRNESSEVREERAP